MNEIEKAERDLENSIKEKQKDIELLKLLVRNEIKPKLAFYVSTLPVIGFNCENLNDAIEILKNLWKYQINFNKYKPEGFLPYYRIKPYSSYGHKNDVILENTVSLVFQHQAFSHGSTDHKLEFYIKIENVEIEVHISIQHFHSITASHTWEGKGQNAHISKWHYRFMKQESSKCDKSSYINQSDPHVVTFSEHWNNLELNDLDKIFSKS